MTTTIGRIIRDAVGKIQPILPFLVMAGAFSNSSLVVITLITVVVELAEWIYSFFKPVEKKKDIYTLTINDTTYDTFYRNVAFLLFDYKLLDDAHDIVINRLMKTHVVDKNYNMYAPIIEPAEGFNIDFKGDNFSVNIKNNDIKDEKSESKKKSYIITSYSKKDIDNFIQFFTEYQMAVIKKKISKKSGINHYISNESGYGEGFKKLNLNVEKTFDNIFLDGEIKEKIIEKVHKFLNNEERYKKLALPYRTGFILHGKPGNGKSSLILALSTEFKMDVYRINLETTKSHFFYQMEKVPDGSIVVFEDIDTFEVAKNRDDNDEKKSNKLLNLGDILTVLDGYFNLRGCIVIMTTNRIATLDPAIYRPGRIDFSIELHNITKKQICDIMFSYFEKKISYDEIRDDIDISVAEFINTHVMPNLDEVDSVVQFLQEEIE